jgi:hypothetical protein
LGAIQVQTTEFQPCPPYIGRFSQYQLIANFLIECNKMFKTSRLPRID